MPKIFIYLFVYTQKLEGRLFRSQKLARDNKIRISVIRAIQKFLKKIRRRKNYLSLLRYQNFITLLIKLLGFYRIFFNNRF